MARHVMTARRKVALRKAQLASAKKRKRSRRTKAVISLAAATAVVTGTTIGSRHVYNANFISPNRRTTHYASKDVGLVKFSKRKKSDNTRSLTLMVRRPYKMDLDFEHLLLTSANVVRDKNDKSMRYKMYNLTYDPLYAGSRKRAWHGGLKKRR
jgi:hypothetical protein